MTCLFCNSILLKSNKKYCNNLCQQNFQYITYINKWKSGLVNGLRGLHILELSDYIRRYIFEKYYNKCKDCGWDKINPFTNKRPLEIDHIDGNYMNNTEINLILRCPNCHSLTNNYKGANKGNGRSYRRLTK